MPWWKSDPRVIHAASTGRGSEGDYIVIRRSDGETRKFMVDANGQWPTTEMRIWAAGAEVRVNVINSSLLKPPFTIPPRSE